MFINFFLNINNFLLKKKNVYKNSDFYFFTKNIKVNFLLKKKNFYKNSTVNFLLKKKNFYKNNFIKFNLIGDFTNHYFFENKSFNYLLKIKNSFYKNNDFFFFKKSKSLLKSGYCRSRPYCKNIVLIGLYINILFIYETNILYYNNCINF